LGSYRPFPVLESLAMLAALAVRTARVELGTGVLVLPLRNPVELAKTTATIDHLSGGRLVLGLAAGWYEKEFLAAGVPHRRRGHLVERNLDVLFRFWSGQEVNGEVDEMVFRRAVMLPPPVQRPRPRVLMGGYADKVLRRVGTLADGWLCYFYQAGDFAESWQRVRDHAEEAGRDPAALGNAHQLPICIDDRWEDADRRVREFVAGNFDEPEWSRATADSAIRGTPEQCREQIAEHVAAGLQHLILVPCDYLPDQVDAIAAEILPHVTAGV
jgi:alkanesulfonate monooxygenase